LALVALGFQLSMFACLIESDWEQAVPHDWTDGDLLITDNRSLLDLDVIHGFLKGSYWSADIPRDLLQRAIDNSIPVGLYWAGKQVGFARVVTDRATFAYLADVFVLESHRGRGLSKQLMRVVMSHPELRSLRRWHLVTRDAHGLYRQFGFSELKDASRHMEIHDRNAYKPH
jgi:GNAT superfamily N-acetyltransferase